MVAPLRPKKIAPVLGAAILRSYAIGNDKIKVPRISFRIGPMTRLVRVKDFPTNRVSAKLVLNFIDDLTPPEEYEKIKLMKELGPPVFHTGKGRPTKKDRRKLDGFF